MADVSSSAASSSRPEVSAVRRLHKELKTIQSKPNPQFKVQPLPEDILEWHFILHDLPDDTPYHKGVYHGKIVFPPNYPHSPPTLYMLTPSGRIHTDMKICLSNTDYHPESWNPAWSVETFLVGFLSYFVSPSERGYGSAVESSEKRQELAEASWQWNAKKPKFRELFPDFVEPPPGLIGPAEEQPPAAPAEEPATLPGSTIEISSVVESPNNAHPQTGEDNPPVANELSAGRTRSVGSNESEPECWICRDSTEEPLIQPCACRGSMSYVHASCVETWVAHHRQNAVNGQEPRCSVCHQVYRGQEVRPGFGQLLRETIGSACCVFLRAAVTALFLVMYTFAVSDVKIDWLPTWLRIVLLSVFGVAYLYKLVVLMVSLPLGHPPPNNRCVRRFHRGDQQVISHVTECVTAVVILTVWTAAGELRWQFLLPVAVPMILPIMKSWVGTGWSPSWRCCKTALMVLGFIIIAPLLVVGLALKFIVQRPLKVLNPLSPGIPMISAVASVVLLWACSTNIPVLVLWWTHTLWNVVGSIEIIFVKKLEWKKGPLWLFVCHFTCLALIAASSSTFPHGLGKKTETRDLIVWSTGLAWAFSEFALSLIINWAAVVEAYHTWQNRHGHFTLDRSPQAQSAGAGDAPTGEEAV